MNDEKLVEVEYHAPELNRMIEVEYDSPEHQTWHAVGELREGSHHLLLISETIEGLDLYTYTIIPRDFIRRIVKLEVK